MEPELETPPAKPSEVERKQRKGLSRRSWWILCGVLLLFALDVSRAPSSQVSAATLLWSIDLYQATFSRLLARSGANCRFEPSCSHYGEAAIRKYGTLRGVGLTARRILRCGPWTPDGTLDEP